MSSGSWDTSQLSNATSGYYQDEADLGALGQGGLPTHAQLNPLAGGAPFRPSPLHHHPHAGAGGVGGGRVGFDGQGGGRDRKFSQKIYVDGLFPPHVRPASVLIGTRGMNHNRMQSSGCTVQLRGKGCSQMADDPVHLLVKYDTEEQFDRFKDLLREIVEGYEAQGPRGTYFPAIPAVSPTSATSTQRVKSSPAQAAGPSVLEEGETPSYFSEGSAVSEFQQQQPAGGGRGRSPSQGDAQSVATLATQYGWNPCVACDDEETLQAEVKFLWLLAIFLTKELVVPFDKLATALESFFCGDTVEDHLQSTSAPAGPLQFQIFVLSCPHLLRYQTQGGRARVSLVEGVTGISKEALKECHLKNRRQQKDEYLSLQKSGALATDNAAPQLPPNPPAAESALSFILQALHFLLMEYAKPVSFFGLEERFMERFNLPLKVSAWGYPSLVALVKAHPTVFSVTGVGRDMKLAPLSRPDFSQAQPANPGGVEGDLSSALAAGNEIGGGGASGNLLSSPSVLGGSGSFAALAAVVAAARSQRMGVPAAATPAASSVNAEEDRTPGPHDGAAESTKSAASLQASVAKRAPRLLGILSRLPRLQQPK